MIERTLYRPREIIQLCTEMPGTARERAVTSTSGNPPGGSAQAAARRVVYRGLTQRLPGSGPMLDELAYDDSEEPAIGLVPPGVSWDEVRDHIKIVHCPLLVGPEAGGQYAGAYWSSTRMVVAGDLGSDPEEALREFRDILRERGEV